MKSSMTTVTAVLVVLLCFVSILTFSKSQHKVEKKAYSSLDNVVVRQTPPVQPEVAAMAEDAHRNTDLLSNVLRDTLQRLEDTIKKLSDVRKPTPGLDAAGMKDGMKVTKLPPQKVYPRVCCFVITDPPILDKTAYVRDTWTRRCDRSFFMSSEYNAAFPTIGLGNDTFSRKHLAAKARKSWIYMYENHINDCEFFLKADPDTYIIMENLKDYLTNFSHEEPLYMGHRYRPRGWDFTYMAGGPGVVLSRTAVKYLVSKAFYSDNRTLSHCLWDGGSEDWSVCKCLNYVGAKAVDTRDEVGRQRFIVFNLRTTMQGNFPKWYTTRDLDGNTMGINCCAEYPIGFHYVSRTDIWELEYKYYRSKKKFDLGINQVLPDKPEVHRDAIDPLVVG